MIGKNFKLALKAIGIAMLTVGFLILILNANNPTVTTAQTYPTSTGTVTTVSTYCVPQVLTIQTVCQALSKTPVNPVTGTTPILNQTSGIAKCGANQFIFGNSCFNNNVPAFVNPTSNCGSSNTCTTLQCPSVYYNSGPNCIINPSLINSTPAVTQQTTNQTSPTSASLITTPTVPTYTNNYSCSTGYSFSSSTNLCIANTIVNPIANYVAPVNGQCQSGYNIALQDPPSPVYACVVSASAQACPPNFVIGADAYSVTNTNQQYLGCVSSSLFPALSQLSSAPTQVCPNNGTPLNGVCPTLISQVSANATKPTQPTVPVAPVIQQTVSVQPVVSVVDDNNLVTTLSSGSSFSLQSSSPVSQLNHALSLISNFKGLSLIGLPGSNTPVDQGFFLISLNVQSSIPDFLTGNGLFWVELNGQELFPSGLQFSAFGQTLSNGTLYTTISLPSGASQKYTFSVPNEKSSLVAGTNTIAVSVSNVILKNSAGVTFQTLNKTQIFSTQVNVDNSDYYITKNAQGSYVLALPSDDIFNLSASANTYTYSTPETCQRGPCYTYTSQITFSAPNAGTATVYQVNADGSKTNLGTVSEPGQSSFGSYSCNPNYYSYGSPTCNPPLGGAGTGTVKNIPEGANIQVVITGGVGPTTLNFQTPTTSSHTYTYSCADNANGATLAYNGASCSFSN